MVSGPPGQVVERLLGFVQMGFTATNFIPAGRGQDEQVAGQARRQPCTVAFGRADGWRLMDCDTSRAGSISTFGVASR